MPRLYTDLASWWPLMSPIEEYLDESAYYADVIVENARGPVAERGVDTVLELGCGGGHNAVHMKARFTMTLTDIAPSMIAQSRSLNPECEHVLGDMLTLRLGRTFDAVFLHDAASYLIGADAVRAAAETLAVHCAPGGVALACPDFVKETFEARTDHGGVDGEDRWIRFLEHFRDPDPDDGRYEAHYVYLLGHPDGRVETVHDVHEVGLQPTGVWLDALEDAGFDAQPIPMPDYPSPFFLGVRR